MDKKEYIEREAAMCAILERPPEPHYPEWYYRDIKEIPAADVAPVVRGEWKLEWDAEKDPKKYFIRIVCSNCGLKTGGKSNFCPNCGAKMDGE